MERLLPYNSNHIEETHRISLLEKIQNFIWGLLLFLSFSLPVNFQEVKIVLLFFLLGISFLLFLNNQKPDKKTFYLFIIWMCFAIPVSLIGFIKRNPGASAFAKVELLYPALLFITLFFISNKEIMSATYKTLLLSAFFISGYTFLLLLNNSGYLHINNFWIIDDTSGVGLHDGYTHITNTNLSMMIFIFPCLSSLSLQERKKLKINSLVFYSCLIVSFIALFLSGRRILWIVAALSLLIVFLRTRLKIWKKIVFLSVLSGLLILLLVLIGERFNITIDGLWERFLFAFAKTDEYGQENVRLVQMEKLIEGFKNNFLIGAGGGAVIKGYSRSVTNPWSFEASYHMILFNSGSFFLIYALFFANLIRYVIRCHKKFLYSFSIFFVLIFAIVANATNPYFSASFDFLFFIFVPILYVNNKRYCLSFAERK